MVIVHIRDEGKPLCGFSSLSPKHWDEGHEWIGVHKKHQATCPGCRRAVGLPPLPEAIFVAMHTV